MTFDARKRQKLTAIGYIVRQSAGANPQWFAYAPGHARHLGWHPSEADAWAACWEHQRSPEGMVLTHSAKERWLCREGVSKAHLTVYVSVSLGNLWYAKLNAEWATGDSPEAAVTALFEKVP